MNDFELKRRTISSEQSDNPKISRPVTRSSIYWFKRLFIGIFKLPAAWMVFGTGCFSVLLIICIGVIGYFSLDISSSYSQKNTLPTDLPTSIHVLEPQQITVIYIYQNQNSVFSSIFRSLASIILSGIHEPLQNDYMDFTLQPRVGYKIVSMVWYKPDFSQSQVRQFYAQHFKDTGFSLETWRDNRSSAEYGVALNGQITVHIYIKDGKNQDSIDFMRFIVQYPSKN